MDYEKKYNEALNDMMAIYPNLKGDAKLAVEHAFPELRESDEERMRRCIGMALTDVDEQRFKDFGTTLKDCLAWLEKQKVLTEHKEGIYYYHRDGTFTFISHPAVENPHNFTVPRPNEKPVDYDHEMWKNCEANFEGGKKEVIEHPEKYGLQKPADWSVEDESELTVVIYCVSRAIKASKDENERNSLLSAKKWLQDKLSFRVKSLRPSWKPSKEQMNRLCAVVDAAIRKHNESVSGYEPARVLKSLYEDLQKL